MSEKSINCLLFLAVSGIGSLEARETNWQPATDGWAYIRQLGDVALYRKPVEGSAFPALLAHTRIGASARAVFEVVADYNRFTEFVPSVTESQILDSSGSTTWVYQRLHFPLLVADRHYIIRVEDRLDTADAGIIHVDWQLDEERTAPLATDGTVLPEAFSGFWHLADSVSGSACDAVYSIHVEPGGRLPAWLFTRPAERYVLDVVTAVRDRVNGRD